MRFLLVILTFFAASTVSAVTPGVSSLRSPNLLSSAVGSGVEIKEFRQIAKKRPSPLTVEGARKLTVER